MKDRLQGVGRLAKAGVAILFMMVGAQAMAAPATAGSHIIQNQAFVDFKNLANVDQAQVGSNLVNITVDTVNAAPLIAFDATTTAISVDIANLAENQSIDLAYTIRSDSNGPLNYTLTPSQVASQMQGAATFSQATYAFDLGATSAAAVVAAGMLPTATGIPSLELSVPSDGATGDDLVNGFTTSDTDQRVYVGAGNDIVCDVTAADDTNGGTANALSTITIANCVDPLGAEDDGTGGPGVVIGDLLGEVITQLVAVTTNLVDVPTFIDGSHAISASVNTTSVPVTAAVDSGATLTVFAANITVHKFVRNVDNTTGTNPTASCTTGTAFLCLTANGHEYYAAGVTALPGQSLEYAILVRNNAGTTKNVVVTDTLPMFLTLANTSLIDLIAAGTALNDDGAACDVTSTLGTCAVTETGLTDPGLGGAYVSFADPLLTASAGHTAGGDAALGDTTGGQLNVDEVSVVFFTVDVD